MERASNARCAKCILHGQLKVYTQLLKRKPLNKVPNVQITAEKSETQG